MAKKEVKAAKPDPKEEKAAEREFKFGVEDIAEELGIKPASVRVQLRNHGVEKAGKSYGWNSKAELKEVIAEISSKEKEEPKAKGKKKPEPEPEPKANKKAKKKPAEDDED